MKANLAFDGYSYKSVHVMKNKALCLIAILVLCGCSKSGLELAPVTGKVTYQNHNLTHGQVVLIPTGETKGPAGMGSIQPDGTYTIMTAQKPGAIVGTHKVTVSCRRKPTEAEVQALAATPLLIPAQYAAEPTTPLTLTVESGGTEYNIDLK